MTNTLKLRALEAIVQLLADADAVTEQNVLAKEELQQQRLEELQIANAVNLLEHITPEIDILLGKIGVGSYRTELILDDVNGLIDLHICGHVVPSAANKVN